MGNALSGKNRSRKHDDDVVSSTGSADGTASAKSKKLEKKQSVKAVNGGSKAQSGVKKKSSIAKRFSGRPNKKKKKTTDSADRDRLDEDNPPTVGSNFINFPQIVISSPSDVEASIEKESAEKLYDFGSNVPEDNVRSFDDVSTDQTKIEPPNDSVPTKNEPCQSVAVTRSDSPRNHEAASDYDNNSCVSESVVVKISSSESVKNGDFPNSKDNELLSSETLPSEINASEVAEPIADCHDQEIGAKPSNDVGPPPIVIDPQVHLILNELVLQTTAVEELRTDKKFGEVVDCPDETKSSTPSLSQENISVPTSSLFQSNDLVIDNSEEKSFNVEAEEVSVDEVLNKSVTDPHSPQKVCLAEKLEPKLVTAVAAETKAYVDSKAANDHLLGDKNTNSSCNNNIECKVSAL